MDIYWIKVQETNQGPGTLAYLQRHPQVLQAQWNHQVQHRSVTATTPSDPLFTDQWALNNTGQNGGTPDADMDAPEAWDLATGDVTPFGDSIVVAVVDAGFDLSHEDIRYFVHANEIPGNGLDDDGNGYIDDVNGFNSFTQNGSITNDVHGTHVAGIAAAYGDNAIGISGVAWGARVLPVQIVTSTEAELVIAYGYVLDQRILYDQTGGALGAYVVATNSSFGVDFADPNNYPLWCGMYDSLGQHGILSAVSTMNIGQNVDVVGDVPSACPSPYVISITNTTRQDVKSGGAAFGVVNIDLGAPGTDILSALPGDTYGDLTGTSMASPQVAGAVAVMHSRACPAFYAQYFADPAAGALQLRQFLLDGVDSLGSLTGLVATSGRLNLLGALLETDAFCATLSSDCLPAYSFSTSQLTDSSALLAWKSGDSASLFWVRYRLEGSASWTDSLSTTGDSVHLQQLQRCQRYEFQVKVICGQDTVDYLALGKFRTEGCCEPPKGVEQTVQGDSALALVWKPVFGANGYEIRWREINNGQQTSLFTADTSLVISGLMPCVEYEFQIASACDSLDRIFSAWTGFRTLGCGVCLDSAYCDSRGSNTEFEWIDSVIIGGLVFASGNDLGYSFNSSSGLLLYPDSSVAVTLVPGFSDFAYEEWWRIWVDWNQNGQFDDPVERVFDSQGGQLNTVTGSFSLPAQAIPGSARMRVSMKFPGFGQGSGPDPCGNFDEGEVEDYCVVIADSGTVACGAPVIQSLTYSPATEKLNLVLDSVATASQYLISISGPGFPNGIQLTSTGPVAEFTIPLNLCASYVVSVQAKCGQLISLPTQQTLKTTGCGPCLDLPYCAAIGLDSDSLWIRGFELNQIQLISNNNNGYLLHDNATLDLNAFGFLSGWLLPASQGLDSSWAAMWIDVNGDGMFQPAETISSGWVPSGDSLNIAWLVPQQIAVLGGRIRMAVSKNPLANSCASPTQGEVEELCFLGIPTSVNEQLAPGIDLAPNPTTGRFELRGDEPWSAVRLFDLQGREVPLRTTSLAPGEGQYEALVPGGVYLLEITWQDGQRRYLRLMRQ